tara:strand:+ start:319 stop:552 length:234 start_codon:yes stop_codon:yes gene_type:complete
MPKIKVLSGGGFPEREVTAATVGALRSELGVSHAAAISVNGTGVTDDYQLQDDDLVAAVENDKGGGNIRIAFKVKLG